MFISPQRIPAPTVVQAAVALEPAYNVILSMISLINPDNYIGVDPWAEETVRQMGEELHQRHKFLLSAVGVDGLINLVPRGIGTRSYPNFLQELKRLDPVQLRDELIFWIFNSPHVRVSAEQEIVPDVSVSAVLQDYGYFEAQLLKMGLGKLDIDGLKRVHAFYQDPDHVKKSLIDHMEMMWERFLRDEWERVEPRLQESVTAFQQVSLQNLTLMEAIQKVTGRDLRVAFNPDALLEYRAVRFIPHLHSGPYVIWFGDDEELRISFPPRIPNVAAPPRTAYDHTALANRYKALGDETRLRMLSFIRESEEVSTQEIIDAFSLDKSAASRYLRQMVATSLIIERRDEGAKKVYRLHEEAIDEIIQMMQLLK